MLLSVVFAAKPMLFFNKIKKRTQSNSASFRAYTRVFSFCFSSGNRAVRCAKFHRCDNNLPQLVYQYGSRL